MKQVSPLCRCRLGTLNLHHTRWCVMELLWHSRWLWRLRTCRFPRPRLRFCHGGPHFICFFFSLEAMGIKLSPGTVKIFLADSIFRKNYCNVFSRLWHLGFAPEYLAKMVSHFLCITAASSIEHDQTSINRNMMCKFFIRTYIFLFFISLDL